LVCRLKFSHFRAVFNDGVYRAQFESTRRHVALTIYLSKNAALIDTRDLQPFVQRLDGPAGEIDDLVAIGT
jgi:hypothetical protein